MQLAVRSHARGGAAPCSAQQAQVLQCCRLHRQGHQAHDQENARKHGKKVKVTVASYQARSTVTKLPASPNLKLAGVKPGQHTLKVTVSYLEAIARHRHRTSTTVRKALTVKFKVC